METENHVWRLTLRYTENNKLAVWDKHQKQFISGEYDKDEIEEAEQELFACRSQLNLHPQG